MLMGIGAALAIVAALTCTWKHVSDANAMKRRNARCAMWQAADRTDTHARAVATKAAVIFMVMMMMLG